ncbi:MAG: uroporphyrinogen-III C-methyltransferase, partial [Caulobacteraceae bacterium]|nr:uroporphyrinogen-III C-methyltransferase [Caulobacteraceae bacterium]
AVIFVTGHAAGGAAPDLDWPTLAKANQTLVVYMGLANAAAIAARMIEAGRAAATPALIVENASLPEERRVVTSLAKLGASAAGFSGPALLIVGEAMATAEASVSFLPPLHGEGQAAQAARVGKSGSSAALVELQTSPPGASRHPPHKGEGGR